MILIACVCADAGTAGVDSRATGCSRHDTQEENCLLRCEIYAAALSTFHSAAAFPSSKSIHYHWTHTYGVWLAVGGEQCNPGRV